MVEALRAAVTWTRRGSVTDSGRIGWWQIYHHRPGRGPASDTDSARLLRVAFSKTRWRVPWRAGLTTRPKPIALASGPHGASPAAAL